MSAMTLKHGTDRHAFLMQTLPRILMGLEIIGLPSAITMTEISIFLPLTNLVKQAIAEHQYLNRKVRSDLLRR